MADTVEFSMTGMDEVIEKLNQMSPMVKKKGGRRALARAASIVRAQARQNARGIDDRTTREMIAKNIAMQWMTRMNRQTGDLGYRIGVRGGARDMSEYGELSGRVGTTPGVILGTGGWLSLAQKELGRSRSCDQHLRPPFRKRRMRLPSS